MKHNKQCETSSFTLFNNSRIFLVESKVNDDHDNYDGTLDVVNKKFEYTVFLFFRRF